jgi:ribonuclease P protein component
LLHVNESFSRRQRLLNAADYRRVFAAPEVKSGQAQVLLLARRNALGHHRLGLAIAKKHIATAAKRNLFKRLARERFRRLRAPNADSCGESSTFDIVVLSRPAASEADRATLGKALDAQFLRLFKRANAH